MCAKLRDRQRGRKRPTNRNKSEPNQRCQNQTQQKVNNKGRVIEKKAWIDRVTSRFWGMNRRAKGVRLCCYDKRSTMASIRKRKTSTVAKTGERFVSVVCNGFSRRSLAAKQQIG